MTSYFSRLVPNNSKPGEAEAGTEKLQYGNMVNVHWRSPLHTYTTCMSNNNHYNCLDYIFIITVSGKTNLIRFNAC